MERTDYEKVYKQCCHQLELQLKSVGEDYEIHSMSGKLIATLSKPDSAPIDEFFALLYLRDSYFKEDIFLLKKDLFTHLSLSIYKPPIS